MRKQPSFGKRSRRPEARFGTAASQPVAAASPDLAARLREFHDLIRELLTNKEALSRDEQIALANLITGMSDLLDD